MRRNGGGVTRRKGALALALALSCQSAGPDQAEGTSTTDPTETGSGSSPEALECTPISAPSEPGEPGEPRLELVATRAQIPGLADQPSTHGQILGSLFAFDGRLHLGYGDYSDNTGPILMSAWDPQQATFVDLGLVPTEEVLWFQPFGDALYTPAVDPTGHQEDGGVYRLDCGASAWYVAPPIDGAVHVYGIATQGEVLYVGTGSLEEQPARVMASTDRGEHWQEVLRHESGPGVYSRVYFLGATPQRLFASGREHGASTEALAWLREGQGDPQPLLDPPGDFLVPITLGDAMLVARFVGNPGRGTYQASFRIEDRSFVPDQPWPMAEDQGEILVAWAPQPATADAPERLLVLIRTAEGEARVHRTDRLDAGPDAWELLAALEARPDDAYASMALLRGTLYLGTRQGSLLALTGLG